IRDRNVTGVQTCALPICLRRYVHLGKPVVLLSTVIHLQPFLRPRRFLQTRLPHRKVARVFHVTSHTKITAARTPVPRLLTEIARSEERRVGKDGSGRGGW